MSGINLAAHDTNKCNSCAFGAAWRDDSYRCAGCVAFSRHVPAPIARVAGDAIVEQDPSGKSSHEPGAKLDAGKTMPSLILSAMPRAMLAVAEVGTFGARKYSRNGWLSVENGVERYTNAMDRHRLYETIDGPVDPQSELLHASHLAWNALARLELMLREAQ